MLSPKKILLLFIVIPILGGGMALAIGGTIRLAVAPKLATSNTTAPQPTSPGETETTDTSNEESSE